MSANRSTHGKSLRIQSHDPDELSELFSQHYTPVKIEFTGASKSIEIDTTVVMLNEVHVCQSICPSGARWTPLQDSDGYLIHLPTQGNGSWQYDSNEIKLDSFSGFVGTPKAGDVFECSTGWSHITLTMAEASLANILSHLLDAPISPPLVFSPIVASSRAPVAAGLSLAALAVYAARDGNDVSLSPRAIAHFSETIIVHVLETFEHNYTSELARTVGAIGPRYVKRAVEFMRANVAAHISLINIAEASGISVRALQYGFKSFVGISPMQYLRNLRLQSAYAELHTAPETVSIAEIAGKWGFMHEGRFAALCKKTYGSTPSSVRKRALLK